MAGRRFVPLIIIVALGTLVLALRLFQVQILEHAVWAREATNLVRSGRVQPYVRGEIRARDGTTLVRDTTAYEVHLRYRDFRRGHPLGQVAHAWSALALRPEPLATTLPNLTERAESLILLTPRLVTDFAKGGGIRFSGDLVVPAGEKSELRSARAADVRFYVFGLLDATPRERKLLLRTRGERADLPYVQLLAEERGVSPTLLANQVQRRVHDARQGLMLLARGWSPWVADRDVENPFRSPLDALLADLEDVRATVEDRAADDLFKAATGFSAGRVDSNVLYDTVDLQWLSARFYWNDERTRGWLERMRNAWLAGLATWELEGAFIEMQLAPPVPSRADVLLSELAARFAAPREVQAARRAGLLDWRTLETLDVFDELDSLFDLRFPPDLALTPPGVLPTRDRVLRDVSARDVDDARPLAYAFLGEESTDYLERERSDTKLDQEAWRSKTRFESVLARKERELAALFALPRRDLAIGVQALYRQITPWEVAFQDALTHSLQAIQAHGVAQGDLPPGGRLPLASGRLDRAQERMRYALRDRGSRPVRAIREPEFDTVQLLTRRPERYRGFQVQEVQRRERIVLDDQGATILDAVLGRVRVPSRFELARQRDDLEQFEELRKKRSRDEADLAHLEVLVEHVSRRDELQGAGGLERYLDPELSGSNGYEEHRGLDEFDEQLARGESGFRVPRVDGRDVATTLDLTLQRAALDVLRHPAGDPVEDRGTWQDDEWQACPAGAIVLITPQGDVRVAASFPTVAVDPESAAVRALERSSLAPFALERTMRKSDFQPPGSVYKPFVALWGLHSGVWTPETLAECADLGGGDVGYRSPEGPTLRCSHSYPDHEINLHDALMISCNALFATLGERLTTDDLAQLAGTFGFGQPTGLWSTLDGKRPGSIEHTARQAASFRGVRLSTRERMQAADGLGVVEATPLQMARAYAGLATGRLPELRLVRAVGGQELEPRGEALPFSAEHLEFVRRALRDVTQQRATQDRIAGSGERALSTEDIGFVMAAKTGSADLGLERFSSRAGEPRQLKHTWLAGWFPPEEPVGILVVFLYRTTRTSGHSSVWVAQQFLRHPDVVDWLRREGVLK